MKNFKDKYKSYLLIASATLTVAMSSIGVNALPNNKENKPNGKPNEAILDFDKNEMKAFSTKYNNVKKLTGSALASRNQKVKEILSNNSLTMEEKEAFLKDLETYHFKTKTDNSAQLASTLNDVELYKPDIWYNAYENTYTVHGMGHWVNNDYDAPSWMWWYPYEGQKITIGGVDALGIYFHNTPSPNPSGVAIVDGWGTFNNGLSNWDNAEVLATSNDCIGGGYKYQDYIEITDVTNNVFWVNIEYRYSAQNFHCYLNYNSNFANLNGDAKFYYSHTWDDTSVNSVGIYTNGLYCGYNENENYFEAFSLTTNFQNGAAY